MAGQIRHIYKTCTSRQRATELLANHSKKIKITEKIYKGGTTSKTPIRANTTVTIMAGNEGGGSASPT